MTHNCKVISRETSAVLRVQYAKHHYMPANSAVIPDHSKQEKACLPWVQPLTARQSCSLTSLALTPSLARNLCSIRISSDIFTRKSIAQ